MNYDSDEQEKTSIEASHRLLDLEHAPFQARNAWRQTCVRWSYILMVVNGVLLLLNGLLFRVNSSSWHAHTDTGDLRSSTHEFTQDAIQLEVRPFDDVFNGHGGPYRGDPRPELDEAWKGLIHGYNTRVPASVWMGTATPNHTLVELTDGSGDHYAVLGVLHDLHCLRTMREYLFPEYYPDTYAMFKPDPDEMIGVHLDHCFDILRQSIMCQADMTLLPLEWWEETSVPQNVVHTPHVCMNWDRVSNWAVEHSFSPFKGEIVRKPGTGTL